MNIAKNTNKLNHKILVMGISGNVSFSILRVLRKNFPESRIIGCCVNKTYNKIFCDKFLISPYADSQNFIPWLVDLCSHEQIDIVFSGVEEIIWEISKHKSYLENLIDCFFTFSSNEKLIIGNNKYKTLKWLKENNLRYPRFILPKSKNDIINFYKDIKSPLILKPIKGKGSAGINICNTLDDINNLKIDLTECICQEKIGNINEEYTVGCYQNINGKIMNPIILRRKLENGHTVFAEIENNLKIKNYCDEIMRKFNPFGPLNIQLRLNADGDPICFELNLRFSGTTLIRDYYGFKDVVSVLKENLEGGFLEENFNVSRKGTFIRFVDEFFFNDSNFNPKDILHYE